MSCIAVPTPFGERFMLSKARGLFKQTPQCKCKDNKNSAICFLFEEKNVERTKYASTDAVTQLHSYAVA